MNRRTFLAICAAATQARAAAGVSRLKYGFTTYEWGQDWDLPTIIANCSKAKAFGVELTPYPKYKHGVDLSLNAEQRRHVKQVFADSPVRLVSINSGKSSIPLMRRCGRRQSRKQKLT